MAKNVVAQVEANFLQSLPLALVDRHVLAQSYRELETIKHDTAGTDLHFEAYSWNFDDGESLAYYFDINNVWRDASNNTSSPVL